MSLKISQIETRITAHPLRPERVVVSSAGCHSESSFLTVRVMDQDGQAGYGEAATVMLWSGESAQNAQWIIESIFASRLIGASLDHPREALAIMDRAAVNNSFTKSAIDTALWDLWAKQQGVPAWKLFADREPVRAIPVRGSIGAYPLDRTLDLARGFWDEGVRTLKFKVGLPGGEDAIRLRAVRDQLGDEPVFTVDYNGTFDDVAGAVKHIESLLPFNIALFEQPTHRDRIHLMAEVRKRVNVPILADESIFTPQHLADALELDAFDILSIYPGKNGGFTHALEMARTASRAGKACTIGSNLETDIGQAAMAALAAGLGLFPVLRLSCDLMSSLYYQRPSVTRPLVLERGRLMLPEGIGFGITPIAFKEDADDSFRSQPRRRHTM